MANGGRYKFARLGNVTAYVGQNNFWRIGLQTDAAEIQGQRRLHVVDDQMQFRLSFAGVNSNGSVFTDFLSNNLGNLQILPSGGRVSINLNTNPTATLDVNGDARIRNVQTAVPDALFVGTLSGGPNDYNVRRLDFNGNAGQVLVRGRGLRSTQTIRRIMAFQSIHSTTGSSWAIDTMRPRQPTHL